MVASSNVGAFFNSLLTQQYWVQYRFNRRFDLAVILPRLLRAAAVTKPLPAQLLWTAQVCLQSGMLSESSHRPTDGEAAKWVHRFGSGQFLQPQWQCWL